MKLKELKKQLAELPEELEIGNCFWDKQKGCFSYADIATINVVKVGDKKYVMLESNELP